MRHSVTTMQAFGTYFQTKLGGWLRSLGWLVGWMMG